MEERLRQLRALSPEAIAGKIKAYRKQYDMTQEALAKRIGVLRYTLIRWEGAKVRISYAMLRILHEEGVL